MLVLVSLCFSINYYLEVSDSYGDELAGSIFFSTAGSFIFSPPSPIGYKPLLNLCYLA